MDGSYSGFKLHSEFKLADHSNGIFYFVLLIIVFLILLFAGCGEEIIIRDAGQPFNLS